MRRIPFNEDWYFHNETHDTEGPWTPVTLPHDAMHTESRSPDTPNRFFTGYHPGGVYRYTKTIEAKEEWKSKVILLEFEAVYHRAKVYINGRLAESRPSGYALFHVRLGEFLRYDEHNVIEVVCDTTDMINTRWYSGAGIYRPVSLLVGAKDHIMPYGLRLTTLSVKDEERIVEVTLGVNRSDEEKPITAAMYITGPNAISKAYQFVVPRQKPYSNKIVSLREFLSLPGAALWSPDTPVLHHIRVELRSGGGIVDVAEDDFGIRDVTLDPEFGLRINGEEIKLRGACVHHDNGVIGATTLDMAEDRRIRILKESGFNAIRSSHNPCSKSILRACDLRGMLVMDELSDVWYTPKMTHDYGKDFMEWWERDASCMMNKHYNHPCVIMNSIGNEIEATALPRGIELNRKIAEYCKLHDPKRFTTNGVNGFFNMIASAEEKDKDNSSTTKETEQGKDPDEMIAWLNHLMSWLDILWPYLIRLPRVDTRTRECFADLDVAGYNYMVERYEGDISRYPNRIIVGTETKHKDLLTAWPLIERYPQLIGDFVWTGWDYLGEAGIGGVYLDGKKPSIGHPWPGLYANTPLIDITGERQTASFLSEMVWGLKRGPYIAVQPPDRVGRGKKMSGWRTTDSISSWSWEGYEGVKTIVEVYADASWVELLLDGSRISWDWAGSSRGYRAEFKVVYRPGVLEAVAYNGNNQEIARTKLVSADTSTLRLSVKPEVDSIRANGQDLSYLPISLTDTSGIVRITQDQSISLTVTGAAYLLGFGNANYLSEENLNSSTHLTYRGRALAVVRAGLSKGEVKVRVEAEGCEPVQVIIPVI